MLELLGNASTILYNLKFGVYVEKWVCMMRKLSGPIVKQKRIGNTYYLRENIKMYFILVFVWMF